MLPSNPRISWTSSYRWEFCQRVTRGSAETQDTAGDFVNSFSPVCTLWTCSVHGSPDSVLMASRPSEITHRNLTLPVVCPRISLPSFPIPVYGRAKMATEGANPSSVRATGSRPLARPSALRCPTALPVDCPKLLPCGMALPGFMAETCFVAETLFRGRNASRRISAGILPCRVWNWPYPALLFLAVPLG